MRRKSNALPGTACLCALGALFCLWAAFGSGQEVCFTAGCPLFRAAPGEPSLWWLGIAGFGLLALLAALGMTGAGAALAALGVAADACLLLLMALTAPCFNCLVAASLLVLAYLGFRKADAAWGPPPGRPVLALVWAFLFACVVGLVVNSAIPLWAITENEEDASVRMFFSPSCPSCRQGVERLAGRVDVAFHPVAETAADVAKVARMAEILDQGGDMVEALDAAADARPLSLASSMAPGALLLRLQLLRNKAHVFLSGGRVVPYLEYRGLPSFLASPEPAGGRRAPAPERPAAPQETGPDAPPGPGDDALPVDVSVAGSCGGEDPCGEDGAISAPRR